MREHRNRSIQMKTGTYSTNTTIESLFADVTGAQSTNADIMATMIIMMKGRMTRRIEIELEK